LVYLSKYIKIIIYLYLFDIRLSRENLPGPNIKIRIYEIRKSMPFSILVKGSPQWASNTTIMNV